MLLDLFKQKEGGKVAMPQQLPTPATQAPQPVAQKPQPVQPTPSVQTPAQQVQSTGPPPVQPVPASPTAQKPAGSLNIDDIYPILLRKIKEEFKSVTNEAEKLRDIDSRLQKVTKTFEDFQKFMEDSKIQISDMKSKTENFDVALYELVTNQFNPFIKRGDEQPVQIAPVQQTPVQPIPPQPVHVAPHIPATPMPEPVVTPSVVPKITPEGKESIEEEYEEELRKAMADTHESLTEVEMKSEPVIKQIVVEDDITKTTEPLHIKQDPLQEEKFLRDAGQLTPGVKKDLQNHDDRKLLKEQILVEDVLDVPKKDSDSDEVTETLSFKETWNDPDAKNLTQTPPKLKRVDLKELLHKFMSKHDPEEQSREVTQDPIAGTSETKLHETKTPWHNLVDEEKSKVLHQTLTNPHEYFWFKNGKVAKSLRDLQKELRHMNHEVFVSHVTSNKNDFANWIRGVFDAQVLANGLEKCHTKDQMAELLT